LALSAASSAGDANSGNAELSAAEKKKQERKIKVREEGGVFAFDTKYGALNPFAIYYGLVAIFLGIPWVATLNLYRLFQSVTGGRFDKQVRKIENVAILVFFLHGLADMLFSIPRNCQTYFRGSFLF
jgi:hypothetical protein